MSNFIQCNTETGEVIYVNLDLVLKVRVLKSKGTQITFVNVMAISRKSLSRRKRW